MCVCVCVCVCVYTHTYIHTQSIFSKLAISRWFERARESEERYSQICEG